MGAKVCAFARAGNRRTGEKLVADYTGKRATTLNYFAFATKIHPIVTNYSQMRLNKSLCTILVRICAELVQICAGEAELTWCVSRKLLKMLENLNVVRSLLITFQLSESKF
ncbi:MAG: hypothetical protein C0463_02100 [Idiomarina sp.]|uniref:Uncharacterized protein n=1 Tax=Aliidiomarina maris TaxID=531312 RepID=A0ABY0BR09_9GAMM|nr:hypothetical protein [Idiomarina sp.]RUO22872.1 hypothetical protein CWE07_10365 [Aliidiomarina maris]